MLAIGNVVPADCKLLGSSEDEPLQVSLPVQAISTCSIHAVQSCTILCMCEAACWQTRQGADVHVCVLQCDQAALTGESLPAKKFAGDVAFSGSSIKQVCP